VQGILSNHGEFSFAAENIVSMSGRILAPNEAKGVVNIGLSAASAHVSERNGTPPRS